MTITCKDKTPPQYGPTNHTPSYVTVKIYMHLTGTKINYPFGLSMDMIIEFSMSEKTLNIYFLMVRENNVLI